jgi:hypothetical protein
VDVTGSESCPKTSSGVSGVVVVVVVVIIITCVCKLQNIFTLERGNFSVIIKRV